MDVTTQLTFHVTQLSDKEWRLLAKGLALISGVKVTITSEERRHAADLNLAMLERRQQVLEEHRQLAEAALVKARAATPEP